MLDRQRRRLLRYGFYGMGFVLAGPALFGSRRGLAALRAEAAGLATPGKLRAPDDNGLRLPAGFRSRVIARSGRPVAQTGYRWHAAPDGGACFARADGGWSYVSNSELSEEQGGAGVVHFDARGTIVGAATLLSGTTDNCAGGPTPWNTWLSCEEHARGRVWECDPAGRTAAVAWPALGVFEHEAVAVDPRGRCLYLTEDDPEGRFYRFTPARWENGRADLRSGVLEVLRVETGETGRVSWHRVADPGWTGDVPTRFQVPDSTPFRGGEGCWYQAGAVYFTTKYDNTVWVYEPRRERLAILYRPPGGALGVLRGVDNITVSPQGDVLVAEDGDDMQIVVLSPDGSAAPLVQVAGHRESEVTGPAFSPDGSRLYFSSQRGATGRSEDGVTYEITGGFPA